MRKIIIIGTGGQTISLIDVIESNGNFEILGLIKKPNDKSVSIFGYETIGTDIDLPNIRKHCDLAAIGIGQIKSPNLRMNIYSNLLRLNFTLPTIASSKSYISKNSKIGNGTIIHHGAIINAGAVVGDN